MKPTDKDWVDAIGAKLTEMLSSCQEINQDSAELIAASTQLGILANPGLLAQWKEGSSVIKKDYFQNNDRTRNSSKRYKITRLR